jgi:dCTP diphosphatase
MAVSRSAWAAAAPESSGQGGAGARALSGSTRRAPAPWSAVPGACDADAMSDLAELTAAIRRFNAERDCDRFHDPKSLTLALVGEVGELAELLQWVRATSVSEDVRTGALHDRLAEELSDILIYLVNIAEQADVDLVSAAMAKLTAAGRKYPAADFAGRAPTRS